MRYRHCRQIIREMNNLLAEQIIQDMNNLIAESCYGKQKGIEESHYKKQKGVEESRLVNQKAVTESRKALRKMAILGSRFYTRFATTRAHGFTLLISSTHNLK